MNKKLEVLKNEEFNMEEQAVEGYDCLHDCGSGDCAIFTGLF